MEVSDKKEKSIEKEAEAVYTPENPEDGIDLAIAPCAVSDKEVVIRFEGESFCGYAVARAGADMIKSRW